MDFVDTSMRTLGFISPKFLQKFRIDIQDIAPLKSYELKIKETDRIPKMRNKPVKRLKLPKIESI